MNTRRTVAAVLGIVAVLVPAAIWAAGPFGHGGRMDGMGFGPLGFAGGNVLRVADKLGLSADQVTQIKGVLAAAQTANNATRDQLRTNQQAFQASYNPAQFNAAAVNAYVAQQTPLLQQLFVSRLQTEANVLGVLTPAQLAQYNQLRAAMEQWRQSNPERH